MALARPGIGSFGDADGSLTGYAGTRRDAAPTPRQIAPINGGVREGLVENLAEPLECFDAQERDDGLPIVVYEHPVDRVLGEARSKKHNGLPSDNVRQNLYPVAFH